ncbi:MAG: metallophosphoesterase [Puniceicoccaceae bacterium]
MEKSIRIRSRNRRIPDQQDRITATGFMNIVYHTRLTALIFILLGLLALTEARAAPEPTTSREPFNRRIVVIGDIHGNHDGLLELLQLAGVTDERGRWTGGKTHFVQLGDIPDRGDDTLEAIKFLRRLERNARRNGGRVHILIGNHDAMNVYGDLRYVTDGEFRAFAEKQSKKRLETLFKDETAWIRANVPEEEWPEFDETYREKWFAARPPGFLEHRWNWLPDGEIGEWVRSRPIVLKLGNTLFVHGGLSPRYADWSVKDLNKAASEALSDVTKVKGTLLRDPEGPLWYRGLAQHREETEWPHVERLLENFDVDRIVIGHTPTGGVILPRFGGRVILADTGLSTYYGEYLACLVIEGNQLYALHRDGQVPIPASAGTKELKTYLQAVLDLEDENPHIKRRLRLLDIQEDPGEDTHIPDTAIEPVETESP